MSLARAVLEYDKAKQQLEDYKERVLPRGTLCRYGGSYTIAVLGDGCPPDKVPLLFENGNTWWKPVNEVTPVDLDRPLPRHARRMLLSWHGYKLLWQFGPAAKGKVLP